MFWAMLGLNMLQGAAQYEADKEEAKAKLAWQKYSNTMTRLSDAMNQNAITENEIITMDAFAEQALDIKKGLLATTASAEVSAAAAGVKGRSVNQSLFDIQRNANIAEGRRQQSLQNAFASFDQQRQSSAMSAALNQDYTYIPKPNFMSYMLKAATNSAQYFGS